MVRRKGFVSPARWGATWGSMVVLVLSIPGPQAGSSAGFERSNG